MVTLRSKGGIIVAQQLQYRGTGRRKTSTARVRLVPGDGNIIINNRSADVYFGRNVCEQMVKAPLEATGTLGKFDVLVNVSGGGQTGQAGAIRHGVARALLEVDNDFRSTLKNAGFLTRDARMKERRKYGLKKARKAPQFSKR